jgi:hypothetical protein
MHEGEAKVVLVQRARSAAGGAHEVDAWGLTMPVVPPRSRLYSLPPMGLDTGMVESLTGYIMRLAEQHCVTTRRLLVREIFSLLGRASLLSSNYDQTNSFVRKHTVALNSVGLQARDMVSVLQQLTRQHRLHCLTMLPWSSVVPWKNLQRRARAWCPFCYDEWSRCGTPIYEPLLWTLCVVRGCAKHRFVFVDRCPYAGCGRVVHVLETTGRPGHCSACGGWLGVPEAYGPGNEQLLDEGDWQWQAWVAEALAEMLAVSGKLPSDPDPRALRAGITMHPSRPEYTNLRQLALGMGVDYTTLRSWVLNGNLPDLSHLLQVAHHLRTTPLRLVTAADLSCERRISAAGDAGPPDTLYDPRTAAATFTVSAPPRIPRRRNKRLGEMKLLKVALEAIAAGGMLPPPSVMEVARRLQVSNTFIARKFPEICKQIQEQYERYVQARKLRRELEITLSVESAVLQVHHEGNYPSLVRVEALLHDRGWMRSTFARQVRRAKLRELGWEP